MKISGFNALDNKLRHQSQFIVFYEKLSTKSVFNLSLTMSCQLFVITLQISNFHRTFSIIY